jgi:hypothetical protein
VVKIAPSILAADFARLKAAGVHVGGQQFILATLEKFVPSNTVLNPAICES